MVSRPFRFQKARLAVRRRSQTAQGETAVELRQVLPRKGPFRRQPPRTTHQRRPLLGTRGKR